MQTQLETKILPLPFIPYSPKIWIQFLRCWIISYNSWPRSFLTAPCPLINSFLGSSPFLNFLRLLLGKCTNEFSDSCDMLYEECMCRACRFCIFLLISQNNKESQSVAAATTSLHRLPQLPINHYYSSRHTAVCTFCQALKNLMLIIQAVVFYCHWKKPFKKKWQLIKKYYVSSEIMYLWKSFLNCIQCSFNMGW